jgi:hypothetical protein
MAFSITLGLGVKAMMNERVGLRLQGRLLMPMNFYGTSFGSAPRLRGRCQRRLGNFAG